MNTNNTTSHATKRHIAVAVSGGSDSSFALALLQEQGYNILAVHAFFLPPTSEARAHAQALDTQCQRLDIPFVAIDLSKEFHASVIAPFARAYVAGNTPNPCAICNPRMKFGLLFDHALEAGKKWGMDIQNLATGHYARIEQENKLGTVLARGKDPKKDQSYFLSLVPRDRLEKAVFPLGTWQKTDIHEELAKRSIEPPLPGESQEICFIPNDDYCAYLEQLCPTLSLALPGKGAIQHKNGDRLGTHRGLWRHTLGQRRGLGVAYSEPLYVVDKNIESNTLIVAGKEHVNAQGCMVSKLNFLVPFEQWPSELLAQTRYRQKAAPVTATYHNKQLTLTFSSPQSSPAPGQVAAVYAPGPTGDIVLGGGMINNIF